MKKYLFVFLAFSILLLSCKKDSIVAGTLITAKGIVFDSVKNRIIPNATVYLYGGNSGFYGITYDQSPIDSVITNTNGDFSFKHIAVGNFAYYMVSLNVLGYTYTSLSNPNSIAAGDYKKIVYQLNDTMERNQNIIISGREFNKGTFKITIGNNPYDTIYVRLTSPYYSVKENYIRLIGRNIDTTLQTPYLINTMHTINYWIDSYKLARDSFCNRSLTDTFYTPTTGSSIFIKNLSTTYQIPIKK